MTIEAKPTVYRDVRFRSRLEARWACFFDELGWTWEYEPMDCSGWVPDFLLVGSVPILVEVKPLPIITDDSDLPDEALKILNAPDGYDVLLVGLSPFVADAKYDSTNVTPIGKLWCREWDHWGRGLIAADGDIWSEFGSFRMRRSGLYDGDHYCSHMPRREAERRWAVGVNATQFAAATERREERNAWLKRIKRAY